MTKFAPVVPPRLATLLRNAEEERKFPILGDYHLLLAHDVANEENEETYAGAYGKGYEDVDFVIMDNSMVELGMPVSRETMKQALTVVRSDCLVLPDVRFDMEATLLMSAQAANEWRDCAVLVKNPNKPFMAVPQGNTFEEYATCARQLAELEGVGYFGIPRSVYDKLRTREPLVRFLHSLSINRITMDPNIHLLGFTPHLKDDLLCSRMQGVMGIDSAVPARMGQAGILMSPHQGDPGPRGDWWDRYHSHVAPTTIVNFSMMRHWINNGFSTKTGE